ncbi:equilibrative nucleoside transporter [Trichuris trichiura]|uniref:Equilibrative nucleoside transporter n=1 Tax=Trichuris trichiura TaxID=36087 RepID=A0A077ZBI9_TRITR|nr:equilibrative nucleoside transporter [Trichuris trichiura]
MVVEQITVDAQTSHYASMRRVDRFNVVYLFFLLHGVGTLLPWNLFINSEAYYTKYKFAQEPEYAKNFLAYVGICAQVPNLIFSLINTFLPTKGGLLKRMAISLSTMAVVFAVTCILPSVDTTQWTDWFFVITMVSVVATCSATGIYQNCVYGLAADFPMKYSNAVVIGSNVSGLITSIMYLISVALSPSYPMSATVYFSCALFTIVTCLLSFLLLRFNRYFRTNYRFAISTEEESKTQLLREGTERNSFCSRCRQAVKPLIEVICQVKQQLFNIFFIFFVTLTIFPAMMANIESSSSDFPLSSRYYSAVMCFLVFNFFAVMGNLVSSWLRFPSARWLWLPVVARALFIPFFLFCNFQPQYRTLPVLINSDWLFLIGGMLMAFTSGHLTSLVMMYLPRLVGAKQSRTAAMMAALFLVLGVVCGVNFTFCVNYVNEKLGWCHPAYISNSTSVTCP